MQGVVAYYRSPPLTFGKISVVRGWISVINNICNIQCRSRRPSLHVGDGVAR